ncbi:helix-turn-helix transcriptional regulator [Corynebacterium ulceribovis]|uniref:helix-turn-helix transcriptional regulator n=1 Tax=Corynebacterium ulceribovis TaxID=487732 RepID=UPI00035F6FEC|nr:helix-turn-helix transcriptional regulator [Corynebacterium ulceribovis]
MSDTREYIARMRQLATQEHIQQLRDRGVTFVEIGKLAKMGHTSVSNFAYGFEVPGAEAAVKIMSVGLDNFQPNINIDGTPVPRDSELRTDAVLGRIDELLDAGLSIELVAKVTKVTRATIRLWQRGKVTPSIPVAAKVLAVSLDDLDEFGPEIEVAKIKQEYPFMRYMFGNFDDAARRLADAFSRPVDEVREIVDPGRKRNRKAAS